MRNKLDSLDESSYYLWTSVKKKTKTAKKPKLFQTALAAFILILVVLLIKQLPSQTTNQTPTTSIETQTKRERVEISGIKVNDFFKTAPETSSYGYTVVSLNPKHQVLYFPDDELFLVSILGNPFDDYVKVAEQAFLEKLGIDEDQACKLNVSITTPAHLNLDKAGEAYELSFCE